MAFPDFVAAGYLASQQIGFSSGQSIDKLRRGCGLDAIISLIASRIILPRALRNIRQSVGPFPVNYAPKALRQKLFESSDTDAVYISSKVEIEEWATSKGCHVKFPHGTNGMFNNIAFIDIKKYRYRIFISLYKQVKVKCPLTENKGIIAIEDRVSTYAPSVVR